MGLPWIRLDTGLPSHDKILNLLADPSPKRWQAAFSFPCSLAWCGDHGTDGHLPATALPFVHATKATAALCVKYDLWRPEGTGWFLPNFAARQELSLVTVAKREAQKIGGLKGACRKNHGPDCGCWEVAATQLGNPAG